MAGSEKAIYFDQLNPSQLKLKKLSGKIAHLLTEAPTGL
jgi:hypothetical protein